MSNIKLKMWIQTHPAVLTAARLDAELAQPDNVSSSTTGTNGAS